MPSSKPPATDPKTDRAADTQKTPLARAPLPRKQTPTEYQFTDFASI